MSDEAERSYLPWIMAALVLVVGGAKLDAARPMVARILALSIPIVPIVLGVKRVAGGALWLERMALAVGGLTVVAAELCVLGSVFQVTGLLAFAVALRYALYAAVVGGIVAHLFEARSQGKARFAGYVAVAAWFGIFISTHFDRDPFAAVLGAFFVAVLVGGAVLLLGELLVRLLVRA